MEVLNGVMVSIHLIVCDSADVYSLILSRWSS